MTCGWLFLTVLSGDLFGLEVGGVGDRDADGCADYALLDPSRGPAGVHWVFSGRDGALLAQADGRGSHFAHPSPPIRLGDLNGDGRAEELRSADAGTGSALLRSGVDGGVWMDLRTPRLAGLWLYDWRDAGDVDGDGTHDVALRAAPDRGLIRADRALWTFVLAGGSGRVLERVAVPRREAAHSPQAYPRYRAVRALEASTGRSSIVFTEPVIGSAGAVVHEVGDLDGDGYSDVLAAFAGHRRMNVAVPAYLRLFSGRDGGVRWSLRVRAGNSHSDDFGRRVLPVGDADGDGVTDLVFGEPGVPAGNVFLIAGESGAVLQRWNGSDPGFGEFFAPVGDVNGDGAADVAISAVDVATGSLPGTVWIVSGGDGSLLRLHDLAGTLGVSAGD